MASDKEIEIGIGLKAGDRSGLDLIKDTANGLDKTREAIAKAQKQGGLAKVVAVSEVANVNALTDRAKLLSQELSDISESMRTLNAADPGFTEKAAQAKILYDQLVELNQEAAKVPTRIQEGARGGTSQVAERVGSVAAPISGVLGSVPGAEGLSTAIRLSGELFNVSKGLEGLSQTLIQAPGILGAVSTSAASAAAAYGSTAAALAPIVVIAAPVVAGLAAVVAILSKIQAAATAAEQAQQKYLDGLEIQIKTDRELADFLAKGDIEGAKQRYKQLQQEQEDANAQLTYLYEEKARIDKEYAELGNSLNAERRSAIAAEGKLVQDEIDKVYKDSFTPVTQALGEFATSLDAIEAAANRKDEIEAQVRALTNRYNLESQIKDLIEAGNTDALEQRRQAIEAELSALQMTIPALTEMADESEVAAQALEQAKDKQEDLNNELGLYSDNAVAAANAQAELNKQTAATLAGFDQTIQLTNQIGGLIKAASTKALDDRLASIELERDAITGLLDELKVMAETSEEAKAKLEQYQNRIETLNGEFDSLSESRPEVRLAEVRKANAEIEKAELETDRRIADIRTAGLAKLAQIETQLSQDRAAAAAKRDTTLGDAETNKQEALAKLAKDYMADEQEAWAKYYKQVEKSDADNKAARLKSIKDTQAALNEAEKSNDVIAFNAAAARGMAALDEIDKQAETRKADDLARFEDERKAAQAANEQRIQDINEQSEKARAAAFKQYDEDLKAAESKRVAALEQENQRQQELIAAEEAGLVTRLAGIQNAYNLEKGFLDDVIARRKSRYDEEDKIVNERLDLALTRFAEDQRIKANAEIAEAQRAIKTKADAEMGTISIVTNMLQSNFGSAIGAIQGGLTGLISTIQAQLAAAANKNYSSSGTFGSSGGGNSGSGSGSKGNIYGYFGTAYANEGIVNKPTVALLGENLRQGEVEAVVKFNPSEGLPPGRLGGGDTYNFNINVADGVSIATFREATNELATKVVGGLERSKRSTS